MIFMSSRQAVPLLGLALLHFLWQGALVGVLVAFLLALVHHASARTRYAAACAGLLAAALCLPVTLVLLACGGPVPLSGPVLLPAADGLLSGVGDGDTYLRWLVAAWAFGVGVLCFRLVGGWLQVRQLKQDMRPVGGRWYGRACILAERLGVRRFELVESARAQVPMVVGSLRAWVLIPTSTLTGMPEPLLEALIAHELAHIRRWDYLVNAMQAAVETLLFYHPAVWWISRRIRVEREHCCDDLAAAVIGDSLVYARALVAMEEMRASRYALAPAANGGILMHRIRRLLGLPVPGSGLAGAWLAAVAPLALLLLLPVSARSQQTPPPPPPPAPAPAAAPAAPTPPATPAVPPPMERAARRTRRPAATPPAVEAPPVPAPPSSLMPPALPVQPAPAVAPVAPPPVAVPAPPRRAQRQRTIPAPPPVLTPPLPPAPLVPPPPAAPPGEPATVPAPVQAPVREPSTVLAPVPAAPFVEPLAQALPARPRRAPAAGVPAAPLAPLTVSPSTVPAPLQVAPVPLPQPAVSSPRTIPAPRRMLRTRRGRQPVPAPVVAPRLPVPPTSLSPVPAPAARPVVPAVPRVAPTPPVAPAPVPVPDREP